MRDKLPFSNTEAEALTTLRSHNAAVRQTIVAIDSAGIVKTKSVTSDEELPTADQDWINTLPARYALLSRLEIATVIKEAGPVCVAIEAELERRLAIIDQDNFNFAG